MILVKIKERNGEYEYEHYCLTRRSIYWYQTVSKEDYKNGKLKERHVLVDFFGTDRLSDEYDKTNRGYWLDSIAIVWVDWVEEITEDELTTLKKFQVV